jgi:REP element-mobilizing transposase RayT
MARARPDYYRGGVYHIYNRGSSRGAIFGEADNYIYVMRKLNIYTQQLDLAMIAYCLLPNHYHMLVRQDGESRAGLLPQRVFNGYTKAYNERYGRTGTLFQGPYRVLPVDDESYLVQLCRYIHANPVVHGLVSEAGPVALFQLSGVGPVAPRLAGGS